MPVVAIRLLFFFDEWFCDKMEQWKLIRFSWKVNRKVILKRSKDLWFHELWINKWRNPICRSENNHENSNYFWVNICSSNFSILFLESCTHCSQMPSYRIGSNIDLLNKLRWQYSNIECYLNGSWVSISTAFPSRTRILFVKPIVTLLLVRKPNGELFILRILSSPMRTDSRNISQCYGHT